MKRPGIALFALIIVAGLLWTPAGREPADAWASPDVRSEDSPSDRSPRQQSVKPNLVPRLADAASGLGAARKAGVQVLPISQYDFEDGVGGPDAQGWTSVDRTEQDGTWFHVDDFAGLSFGALVGSQSLWCGTRGLPGSETVGYANDWYQLFESIAFSVTGDVSVQFQIRYDCEPGFDFAYFEYLSAGGDWQTLVMYDGQGSELFQAVIPAADLNGQARLRFRFESDPAWSDEDDLWPTDGAVVIDDLQVDDTNGLVDFQDFEAEVAGALTTVDGDWTASPRTPFGDFTNLFDGPTVLQEDPMGPNNSWFWGFFDGSPDNYDCGGHPEQLSVPLRMDDLGIENEIRSPFLLAGVDENLDPLPANSSVLLRFEAYTDLPLNYGMMLVWWVRSRVAGELTPWTSDDFIYYDPSTEWREYVFDIGPYIDPSASEFQVAIGALDIGGIIIPVSDCHSHGPLIDNVVIEAVTPGSLLVTNTGDRGPGSLRDAIEQANASTAADTILFDIPGPGPHTIDLATELPSVSEPVVIDARTQPGYPDSPIVEINGGNGTLGTGLHVTGDDVDIVALGVRGFSDYGIQLVGDRCDVRRCYLGVDTSGADAFASGVGVEVTGDLCRVGTQAEGDGNLIANSGMGVLVDLGGDNEVRANTLRSHSIAVQIGTDSSGNLIQGNDCDDNFGGVDVEGSSNSIWSNSITGRGGLGRCVEIVGTQNDVRFNTLLSAATGVYAPGSSNVIEENSIRFHQTGVDIRGDDNSLRINTIGDNTVVGIVVSSSFGTGNDLQANVMSNNGFGIDLGGDGKTLNDDDDVDAGANNLQNHPEIDAAYASSGNILARLDSAPETTYRIDFYGVSNCHPSGRGEADVHLGEISVTTDENGLVRFSHQLAPGSFTSLSATATDPDGNTSEFSLCYTQPAGFVVTNTLDSGVGSLRAALEAANANPDHSLITFDVPGDNVHVIQPASSLPTIIAPATIDGFSEPLSRPNTRLMDARINANPRIVINAINVGGNSDGLFVAADGSTVRGLVVNRAPGAGIAIQAKNCVVEGCYIGTTSGGFGARPNATAGVLDTGGIRLQVSGSITDPHDNLIGGPYPLCRNLISGNDEYGIHCSSPANTFQGNFIGVKENGLEALANAKSGIQLENWANDCKVGGSRAEARNLISGNVGGGVILDTADNTIQRNYIGTDRSGLAAIANSTGISIYGAADDNLVGGNFVAANPRGNIIAFNTNAGVDVGQFTTGSTVRSNSIHSNGSVGIEIAPPLGAGVPASWTDTPVITNVDASANRIQGSWTDAPPSSLVRFDMYASDACDGSGSGEGQMPLGSGLVSTGFGSVVIFNVATQVPIVGGQHITVTVTPGDGKTSEFSNCFEAINTPTGSNVVSVPVDEGSGETPVTLTFDNVSSSGNTTLTITTPTLPPPSGFLLGDTVYELDTDADFDEFEICIEYDENDINGNEDDLQLFHIDETTGVEENITTFLDTDANIICGRTDSFSAFAPATPLWANATSAPLDDTDQGVGAAWGDYDDDGDADLYLVNSGQANHLYRNDEGVFVDVTTSPLDDTGLGNAAVWGDFDGDKDLDLYLSNAGGANRLFENIGGSSFADVTAAPLDDAGDGRSVAWVDHDNDGDLDLYLVNEGQANRLFRNDGGVFVDSTPPVLADAGNGRGVAWADYDDDGDADLYLTNSGQANKLIRNDGSGVFVDATAGALGDAGNSRGACWGDFDNDGDLDLFLTNEGTADKLFRNDGGSFVDITAAPLGSTGASRSAEWVDVDLDGKLDLYVVDGAGANLLYVSDSAGGFELVDSGPIADEGLSASAAWSDYDGDGDVDTYIPGIGTNALIENQQPGTNHWLHVGLRGKTSNRDAVGARVVVTTGSLVQIRELQTASGLQTQNSATLEFGLGAASTVDLIEVFWPSGMTDTLADIAVDQVVEIREKAPTGADSVPALPKRYELQQNYPNPFNPRTTIAYDLPRSGHVALRIYNVSGRLVRTLFDGVDQAGRRRVVWDGTSDSGAKVATGVYLVRLQAKGFQQVRKMVLLE